jgi:hypothetical protein
MPVWSFRQRFTHTKSKVHRYIFFPLTFCYLPRNLTTNCVIFIVDFENSPSTAFIVWVTFFQPCHFRVVLCHFQHTGNYKIIRALFPVIYGNKAKQKTKASCLRISFLGLTCQRYYDNEMMQTLFPSDQFSSDNFWCGRKQIAFNWIRINSAHWTSRNLLSFPAYTCRSICL